MGELNAVSIRVRDVAKSVARSHQSGETKGPIGQL